jgi:hypothetical protein
MLPSAALCRRVCGAGSRPLRFAPVRQGFAALLGDVAVHATDLATREITPYLRNALRRCDWAPLTGKEVELEFQFEE